MWQLYLLKLLTNIPAIVTGIESIHGHAVNGATKKQLALESLRLATGVGGEFDPKDKAAMEAAEVLASQTIDGVVAVMNAAKAQAPSTATGQLAPRVFHN